MIELRNLQKMQGQQAILDVPALSVQAGEVVAVVGPQGSGKKELLALLLGETQPSAGEIHLAGLVPFENRKQLSSRLGMVYAQNALYDRLTVFANLSFFCELLGLEKTRAKEVIDQVGLRDHADVQAGSLSPGLARRLTFGRALLNQPKILLLEEPFARCDAATIQFLHRMIRDLANLGAAVLILASEATELSSLCNEIYELEGGHLAHKSSPEADRKEELPFKIPARMEGRIILVNPVDILYAFSEGSRSTLHLTDEQEIPTQFGLSELEVRLSKSGFFRAHRSYLVNLQHIKAVIPYTRDSYTLTLDNQPGTEVPLSKASYQSLRDLLGY